MADFGTIVRKVISFEGGYQNHPSDYGNCLTDAYGCSSNTCIGTNHGIGAATLQEYIKGCPSQAQMINLSKETARAIYKNLFWDKIGGDYIADKYVAHNIFDCYINQMKLVKYILRNALAKCGITVTVGLPFSTTVINAVNQADQKTLFNAINEQRRAYYTKTAEAQGRDSVPQSWLDRCSLDFGDDSWMSFTGDFQNACGEEPTDEEMDILEAANSDLATNLKHIKNMRYGWWSNNYYYVLIPASLIFIAMGLVGYKKWFAK